MHGQQIIKFLFFICLIFHVMYFPTLIPTSVQVIGIVVTMGQELLVLRYAIPVVCLNYKVG